MAGERKGKPGVSTDTIIPAPPDVPSTILLSDDSPAVLPDKTAERLADLGWDVRRLPGVGHDFWLQDPDGTTAAIRDLLVGERTQP